MLSSERTTKLRIHTWPEDILRKKCKEVKVVDDSIRQLLGQMHSLMVISDGAGLAANQAGLDVSLVVIEAGNDIFKLVNPKIVKREGRIKFTEGCLSFPGLTLDINRSKKIWVKALNERGEALSFELDGFLAIVFQHEIDHINGIVFIDRASMLQKLRVAKQLKKIKEATKNEMSKRREE